MTRNGGAYNRDALQPERNRRMSKKGVGKRREPSTSMLRLGVCCCVGVAMMETDMVICCSPMYHVRQRSSLLGGRHRAAPLRCSLKRKEKMDCARRAGRDSGRALWAKVPFIN